MDFVIWGRNPWGQELPVHAGWDLIWLSAIGGLAFLVVHAIYMKFWPKPAEDPAQHAAAERLTPRFPERITRHTLGARLFHWVMAASMLVLLISAFLPIVGIKFAWVKIHWIAGLVLLASILYHIVHATTMLDFWSIWPTAEDVRELLVRFRRGIGQSLPAPRKFGKYPMENKLYHLGIVATGLGVAVTGIFMLKRVPTGLFVRNPYVFGDMTWAVMYLVHGFAGIGLIGLITVHVYFAIRPEKWEMTQSMLFGWISRRHYLEHHDPQRWVVPGAPQKPSGPDQQQIAV